MSSFEELESLLPISDTNFDDEALKQPVLFQMVCTQVVESWHKYSQYKLYVEKHEAQVELEIRRIIKESSTDEKKDKVTEAQIAARVLNDESVLTAKLELVKLEAELKRWSFLRQAYEMRSETIKVISHSVNSGFRQYQ